MFVFLCLKSPGISEVRNMWVKMVGREIWSFTNILSASEGSSDFRHQIQKCRTVFVFPIGQTVQKIGLIFSNGIFEYRVNTGRRIGLECGRDKNCPHDVISVQVKYWVLTCYSCPKSPVTKGVTQLYPCTMLAASLVVNSNAIRIQ